MSSLVVMEDQVPIRLGIEAPKNWMLCILCTVVLARHWNEYRIYGAKNEFKKFTTENGILKIE